jgi:hypothetical protein
MIFSLLCLIPASEGHHLLLFLQSMSRPAGAVPHAPVAGNAFW